MYSAAGWLLLLSSLISFLGCGRAGGNPPAKTSVVPKAVTFQGNPAPPAPGSRLWTKADRSAVIRAYFVSLTDDKVRLRAWDGTEIITTLDQLSQADRDWIEAHRQEQ